MPFFFSLYHFKQATIEERKTRVTILSSVAVLFIIAILITQFFITTSAVNSRELINKEAKLIENGINSQISSSINQLRDLANFIQNNPDISKESFKIFVESIYTNSTAIKAMSWNPIIAQEEKPSHEAKLSQIYSEQLPIKGKSITDDDPIIYVQLISPKQGNEKAIGFNVYSNPSRKTTLKTAVESYQARATPIIQLVQSDAKEPAFLLFFPVFEKIYSHAEETTKHLKGFATAVFLAEKMLTNAFTEQQEQLFYFEVFEENKKDWFFTNTLNTENTSLSLHRDLDNLTNKFDVAGQQWKINLLANKQFIFRQEIEAFLTLYLLLVIIVITIVTSLLLMNNRQLALDNLVNQRTKSLNKAVQDANYANKAKSQFLANMSHEIRTPMNSVVGFANLAQEANNLEEIRPYLDNIEISSDLLINIVNDIIDISKIESEKLTLHNDTFDLHLALNRIHSIFEVQASSKKLTWTLIDNLPAQIFIKGDQTRFEQVLMNLCGNAMKFTEQGGVSLSARLMGVSDHVAHLQIIIKDTGIGIAEENIDTLFKPFTQADSSTSRDFGGTGLGLTISKKLSQLMGGDISVESTIGEGSVFSFTCILPIVAEKVVEAKCDDNNKTNKDITKLKVLVAEDNRINQKLIDTILKKLGITAVIVENGQLAVDYIKEKEVDVVLMDCQMPVLDGYEATKQIRALPEFNRLAIFALTADVDTRSKDKALKLGFDRHLGKPIDIIELTESLQSAIKA
jgi:signal transduction histidine kinase/ActR/RegA family two-component response regulator